MIRIRNRKLPDEKNLERIFIKYVHENDFDVISNSDIRSAIIDFICSVDEFLKDELCESEDEG